MLSVENLVVRYGSLTALHEVSLRVADGDFVAVLGRNGAGKSTLVNAVAGLLPVSGGRILHGDQRIDGARPAAVVRHGISVVPEGRQLFGALSVLDNLRLGAYGRTVRGLRGFARSMLPGPAQVQDRVEQVLRLLPELEGLLGRQAGVLSGGQQQMVAVGRALMAEPTVLLIDELSLGLAPLVVERLLEHLAALNEKGIGIVLIEQNIALALRASRRAYVLENGIVRASGPSDDVANDGATLAAYLGVSEVAR